MFDKIPSYYSTAKRSTNLVLVALSDVMKVGTEMALLFDWIEDDYNHFKVALN